MNLYVADIRVKKKETKEQGLVGFVIEATNLEAAQVEAERQALAWLAEQKDGPYEIYEVRAS